MWAEGTLSHGGVLSEDVPMDVVAQLCVVVVLFLSQLLLVLGSLLLGLGEGGGG